MQAKKLQLKNLNFCLIFWYYIMINPRMRILLALIALLIIIIAIVYPLQFFKCRVYYLNRQKKYRDDMVINSIDNYCMHHACLAYTSC